MLAFVSSLTKQTKKTVLYGLYVLYSFSIFVFLYNLNFHADHLMGKIYGQLICSALDVDFQKTIYLYSNLKKLCKKNPSFKNKKLLFVSRTKKHHLKHYI